MVTRPAVNQPQMHVGGRGLGEAAKEILDQLGLQVAHETRRKSPLAYAVRSPAEIDGRRRERFVHGHQEISGAQDAALGTQRLPHRFAERDAQVFDGVMLIDVEVALG